MSVQPQPVGPPDRVLSTLNQDGSRRWIRPRPSHGGWWNRRRVLAYMLMFVFFAIPYVKMNGKPLILLDLPHREFSLFGTTFLPTDTLLFMLLALSLGVTIFLVTALFGRVWCGWGCPQTVYMEYLFRPIERWLEGGFRGSQRLDRRGGVPGPGPGGALIEHVDLLAPRAQGFAVQGVRPVQGHRGRSRDERDLSGGLVEGCGGRQGDVQQGGG